MSKTYLYRLWGDVHGQERSYLLPLGSTSLGSLATNDVELGERGVSRHHAVLSVEPDGTVSVEDLGSKNGTLKNGERVRFARLEAGDELTLGTLRLELEALPPDEAELAIVTALDETPRLSVGDPGEQTATTGELTHGSAPDNTSLLVVEGVLEALCGSSSGDPGDALAVLVQKIGVRGGCLVEGIGEQQVVLAARGDAEELALAEELQAAWKRSATAGDARGGFAHLRLAEEPPVVASVRMLPEREPLSLVLWGESKNGLVSGPLLRLVLRLLDVFRSPEAGSSTPDRGPSGLRFPPGYIAGSSHAMRQLYRQMESLAASDLPVLITGETGVGKEYVARILHESSDRREGPLVAVNCAALPADLLEAEMFGVGKGVATGVAQRRGKFELADGGTLFLDEIGELAPALQAKLLRALQEREIQPLGAAARRVDVRILAATNLDLEPRVADGELRRDLYYRLAGGVLQVPSLDRRRRDIPALVEGFLRRAAHEAGKPVRGMTLKALRRLVEQPWPGNVRQLEHVARRLVALCAPRQPIDSSMLAEPGRSLTPPADEGDPTDLTLKTRVRQLEHQLISRALAEGGSQAHAARLLGIARNTLIAKMKQLELVGE